MRRPVVLLLLTAAAAFGPVYAGSENVAYDSIDQNAEETIYSTEKERRDEELARSYRLVRERGIASEVYAFLGSDYIPEEYRDAARLLKAGVAASVIAPHNPEHYRISLGSIRQFAAVAGCAETEFLLGYYLTKIAGFEGKDKSEEVEMHFKKALETEPYQGDIAFIFQLSMFDFSNNDGDGCNSEHFDIGAKGAAAVFLGMDPDDVFEYVEEARREEAKTKTMEYLQEAKSRGEAGVLLRGKCNVAFGSKRFTEVLIDPPLDLDKLWRNYVP